MIYASSQPQQWPKHICQQLSIFILSKAFFSFFSFFFIGSTLCFFNSSLGWEQMNGFPLASWNEQLLFTTLNKKTLWQECPEWFLKKKKKDRSKKLTARKRKAEIKYNVMVRCVCQGGSPEVSPVGAISSELPCCLLWLQFHPLPPSVAALVVIIKRVIGTWWTRWWLGSLPLINRIRIIFFQHPCTAASASLS